MPTDTDGVSAPHVHASQVRFRQRMDNLNRYISQKNLDAACAQRLREYLYRYEPVQLSMSYHNLVKPSHAEPKT